MPKVSEDHRRRRHEQTIETAEDDRVLVGTSIERVGLAERASEPVATLSGGQQQRAFIAKALAGEPDLLVFDEPTAGVDVDAQESLATLLAEVHDELDTSILFVSHEFGAVEQFVQRLVLVLGGIAAMLVFSERSSTLGNE